MKRLLLFLYSIEDYLTPVFLFIMSVAVAAQIFFRLILHKPLLYTEEIARFSYIWCVYLCIAMGEKYEEHFFVDFFVKFLKGKPDQLLHVIEKALGCLMFGVLFFWSIKFWSFQRINKSAAFGISMSYVAASMCVGFFLSFIRRGAHFLKAVNLLFRKGSNGKAEHFEG